MVGFTDVNGNDITDKVIYVDPNTGEYIGDAWQNSPGAYQPYNLNEYQNNQYQDQNYQNYYQNQRSDPGEQYYEPDQTIAQGQGQPQTENFGSRQWNVVPTNVYGQETPALIKRLHNNYDESNNNNNNNNVVSATMTVGSSNVPSNPVRRFDENVSDYEYLDDDDSNLNSGDSHIVYGNNRVPTKNIVYPKSAEKTEEDLTFVAQAQMSFGNNVASGTRSPQIDLNAADKVVYNNPAENFLVPPEPVQSLQDIQKLKSGVSNPDRPSTIQKILKETHKNNLPHEENLSFLINTETEGGFTKEETDHAINLVDEYDRTRSLFPEDIEKVAFEPIDRPFNPNVADIRKRR